MKSLTPANVATEGLGLAVLFYQPHSCFASEFGLDAAYNGGEDPFEIAMRAQYELTKRNTFEFSIRPFLARYPDRTFARLRLWMFDAGPHVRRLCSEGVRSRLPWATRLPAFIADPTPTVPILAALKRDQGAYVRRSVANCLGDIAKDHLALTLRICDKWLMEQDKDINWVVLYALRYTAKKGDLRALKLRAKAKSL